MPTVHSSRLQSRGAPLRPFVHRTAAMFLAALPLAALPATVGALEADRTVRPVPIATWVFTGALLSLLEQNPCLSDDLAAIRLARFPEGLALIRMRADLDAAERLETARLARESRSADGQFDRLRSTLDSMVRDLEQVSVLRSRSRERSEPTVAALRDEQRTFNIRVRLLASRVDSVVQITRRRADAMSESAPTGYLGVALSSVPVRQALRSGFVVSYCEYPLVEAVDPGSPAERGGLRAGDTLVAFNGRDVLTDMVDYTAMLIPGRTVRIAVQRAGRRLEFPLQVEARPEPTPYRIAARWDVRDLFGDVGTLAELPLGWFFASADSVRAAEPASTAPRAPRRAAMVVDLRSSGLAPLPAAWPQAVPSVPAMVRFAPGTDLVLAGAKLQSLGAELRASLALPEGVLVLEVLRGTPAFDSGLRAGEVIRRADARVVRRVEELRAALAAASDARTLRLDVVDAQGVERTVQLRW